MKHFLLVLPSTSFCIAVCGAICGLAARFHHQRSQLAQALTHSSI